jgi:hypothetical protein
MVVKNYAQWLARCTWATHESWSLTIGYCIGFLLVIPNDQIQAIPMFYEFNITVFC